MTFQEVRNKISVFKLFYNVFKWTFHVSSAKNVSLRNFRRLIYSGYQNIFSWKNSIKKLFVSIIWRGYLYRETIFSKNWKQKMYLILEVSMNIILSYDNLSVSLRKSLMNFREIKTPVAWELIQFLVSFFLKKELFILHSNCIIICIIIYSAVNIILQDPKIIVPSKTNKCQ